MLYATVIVCWVGMGCLLGESYSNPYDNEDACKKEVAKMVEDVTTPPFSEWGKPASVMGKCVTERQLRDTISGTSSDPET